VKCWNASEAARRAGYSEKTARFIGCENLTKPNITAEIDVYLAEIQMSANEVLARLTEQARGTMADFVDPETVLVNLSKAKQANRLHLLKSFSHTVGEKTDTVKIELYDAQAALALLGRAHKLFIDKTEVSGDKDNPLLIDDIGANAREQLISRINGIAARIGQGGDTGTAKPEGNEGASV
jgi:phage terminase small subunit